MTTNIHAVKSITAMQDERRKGNVRPRGCVQVAFITSDGVIKVSTLPASLSTPPSFCLDTQKNAGAWRCVGESKKPKGRERDVAARIVRAGMWHIRENVVAYMCIYVYTRYLICSDYTSTGEFGGILRLKEQIYVCGVGT